MTSTSPSPLTHNSQPDTAVADIPTATDGIIPGEGAIPDQGAIPDDPLAGGEVLPGEEAPVAPPAETPAAELPSAIPAEGQPGDPKAISTGVGIIMVSLSDTRGPTTTLPVSTAEPAATSEAAVPPPPVAAPVEDPAGDVGDATGEAGSSVTVSCTLNLFLISTVARLLTKV